MFGSPLFVFFFSLSHPLSPSNRWGILMKSALPVPICVRNEFRHFLNEGIYNQTGWNAGNPCTEYFCFFLPTLLSSCTYCCFTAFVSVSVCLSVYPSFFQYSLPLICFIFIMLHVYIKTAYVLYVKNVYSLAKK